VILDKIRGIYYFFRYLIDQYMSDDCQETASALTYQTLFAVVPLLTVMYSLASAFQAFGGLEGEMENLIFENVVPENISEVRDYLQDFSSQARNLSGVSLAFLAITSFLMLFTIERTFNEIWHVNEPRHGFQRFLMYWAILSMSPFLIAMGIALSTYIYSLTIFVGVGDSIGALRIVPILFSASGFTLMYMAVPNCFVPFKHAVIGGLCSAITFEVAKFLFVLFMSQSSIGVIYGSFAAVPLFLVWIYTIWTIVLIGAELVKSLSVYPGRHKRDMEHHLYQVLVVLEMFYQAHLKGDVINEADIIKGKLRIDAENWNQYKTLLIGLNLIKALHSGFVLTKDIEHVTLWDLATDLPWALPEEPARGDKDWEILLSETFKDISARNAEILSWDLESLFMGRLDPKQSHPAVVVA